MDKLNSLEDLGASSEASTKPLYSEAGSDHVVDSCLDCNKNALLCESCHFDRVSNDEFSVECLFWLFQPT